MPSSDADHLVKLQSRTRAPVIWVLLPLIAGYLIGKMPTGVSNPLLVIISIGFILLGGYAFWTGQNLNWVWKILGIFSIFIISWGYLLLHLPPSLNWEDKPEREAHLTLKVIRTFSLEDKYNRKAGYGKIVDAPKHLKMLIGQKIYYFISTSQEKPKTLVRSEIIEIRGLLAPIIKNTENGFEKYLFSQGIGFKLSRGQFLKTKTEAKGFYKFCETQNRKLNAILDEGKSAHNSYASNIYKAMLLGNKVSLTENQKYAFQTTGSLHLFSISGLHVGVIAGCIAFLLQLIKIKNPWTPIIGLITLFLYVEITGGAPAAMRAFLMVAFYWGGRAFQRKSSAFSALLTSALVALILNPFDLWNIGFQLSYTVVGSILLYGLPLNEIINNYLNVEFRRTQMIIKNGLQWLINLLGISIAANIGITFLSIRYFSIFAPGSIFLSIIIIPLASVIIIIGFISLLVGLIGLNFISGLINPISWMIIRVMEMIIAYSLKIPGLFWESFRAGPLLTYISIGILFAFLYWGHRFNKLHQTLFYLMPIGMIGIFVGFGI